jgi:NAD(P)-dependent dehydrogenase (short-subunit alcohol dehydrogenase family)
MARKALITAGAGGIGAAIALRAKADGYDVTISDIDDAAGEKLAAEHGHLHPLRPRRRGPSRCADQEGRARRPAGQQLPHLRPDRADRELATTDWNKVLAINVTAAFIACREVVRLMKPAGGGTIVNMASARCSRACATSWERHWRRR